MMVDTIVIGAGAAGLFAASQASKLGKQVLVLEHSNKIGEKIRISGGGRCNFTNVGASPENYLSQNPHFCKSAFSAYAADDFIRLVESYKIPYHEKKLGQLFCDESSQAIIDLLLNEAKQVKIFKQCSVAAITKGERFLLKTNKGEFETKQLIIATGGLSIPQLGASDFAYRMAKQFDLNVIEPKPGLVPFTCRQEQVAELAGISFDSLVTLRKTSFRENILFTHRGLSGPAILQISSYWNSGETITINLLPDRDLYQELIDQKSSTKLIKSHLDFPEKFITKLGEEFDLSQKLCETSNAKLKAI
ncbi:MAG: aminoacetone oxidase family FAD-binding enzyme [Candidatus Melainabacteria bacterium]|nr:aminoacetone oxidase family FAD-binding enzyme [Candidatus Melainabacteria bacterium]